MQLYKTMTLERECLILRQIVEGMLVNLVFTKKSHCDDRPWSVSGFVEGRVMNQK